jgi:hypothetical protein
MSTHKTLQRWAKDIAATKSTTGKRVDSLRFHEVAGGRERVSLILHDGTRLVIEGGGPLRAWTYCCGKPDPGPAPV